MIKDDGTHAYYSFQLAMRKVIDNKSGGFVKFADFNSCVANLADTELLSRGYKAMFVRPGTHYGSRLNLCIVSLEDEEGEYLLNEDNLANLVV
jgi:hypothetical protein